MKNIKAWKLVDKIIDEIRQGARLHNQEKYHSKTNCGTAHCIAGWYVHEKLKPSEQDYSDPIEGNNLELSSDFLKADSSVKKRLLVTEWNIAESDLDISFDDALSIFSSSLTIEEISYNWEQLKKKYDIMLK